MCSNNLFLLSLVVIFPLNSQLSHARVVPSSEKEDYTEIDATEDATVVFTSDNTREFDLYDGADTVTKDVGVGYSERDEVTSSVKPPFLEAEENVTNSEMNATQSETELPFFLGETETENITDNANVTDEMDIFLLSTTDPLIQTEVNQFEESSRNLETYSTSDLPLFFNTNSSADSEEFFSVSTEMASHGISDAFLQENYLINDTVSSDMETGDATEIGTDSLIQGQNTVPVSAWSDVVNRYEGEEERKERKSTSDIVVNGTEENDPGCGIPRNRHHSRQKRIVGGIRTVYGDIPWLVSLRFRGEHPFMNKTGFNHLCGANLIHPQWLLSAAHCFNVNISGNANMSDASFWYAVLGENSLSGQEDTQKIVEIDKIIAHELFSHVKIRNDIALLKLSEPITETDYIKWICLDREKIFYPGEVCTVAGWGMHSFEGNGSAYAFQAKVQVLSRSQCKDRIKNIPTYAHFIYSSPESTFCAHSDDKQDTCFGDSGGPLQCLRKGRWYLTGVTSAGYKCGEAPGVYGRIGYFIDWIDAKMRDN